MVEKHTIFGEFIFIFQYNLFFLHVLFAPFLNYFKLSKKRILVVPQDGHQCW